MCFTELFNVPLVLLENVYIVLVCRIVEVIEPLVLHVAVFIGNSCSDCEFCTLRNLTEFENTIILCFIEVVYELVIYKFALFFVIICTEPDINLLFVDTWEVEIYCVIAL